MSEEIQETQKKQEVAKYIYILVIFIGLIVLGSTYIAYTYFNTSKNNVSTDDIANVDVTEVVPVTDDSGFQTPVLGDSFGITDGREVADNSVKTLVPVPAKEVEAVQLEKTTGASGVDTRLIADITERAHTIMRQLGLDVRDTTCEELYYA